MGSLIFSPKPARTPALNARLASDAARYLEGASKTGGLWFDYDLTVVARFQGVNLFRLILR